ncbi:hypothetical protein MTO96_005432 [Rhipicephalus appendiculatus]
MCGLETAHRLTAPDGVRRIRPSFTARHVDRIAVGCKHAHVSRQITPPAASLRRPCGEENVLAKAFVVQPERGMRAVADAADDRRAYSPECGPATLPGHYAAAAEKLFPRWLAWESGSSCDACPLAVGRLLHACDDDDMMDSDVPGASGGGEEATGAPTRARNRAAQHSGVAHATERTCSARA